MSRLRATGLGSNQDPDDWREQRVDRDREAGLRATEIFCILPDGREEVFLRYPENSKQALELIREVLKLKKKRGSKCPFGYRNV